MKAIDSTNLKEPKIIQTDMNKLITQGLAADAEFVNSCGVHSLPRNIEADIQMSQNSQREQEDQRRKGRIVQRVIHKKRSQQVVESRENGLNGPGGFI